MGTVRIGCSGRAYRDRHGVLCPEGLPQRRRLERYAEALDTVAYVLWQLPPTSHLPPGRHA